MPPPRLHPPKQDTPKPPLRQALAESARYIRRALGLVWRVSPRLTSAFAVLVLVSAAIGPAIALAGKRIVDAIVAHDRRAALVWVAAELGLVALQATNSRVSGLVRTILGSRLGNDINVAILERAQKLELRHFEDPEFYDRLVRARREASSRPLQLVTEAFSLVQSTLTLLGYGVLLVRFSGWVVVLLALATIPAAIAESRYAKQSFRIRNWRSPEGRRLNYLEFILANDEHAKEMKLFGLGPLFLGRYKALSEKFLAEDTALAVRRTIVTHLLSLLATLTFYGAYAWMAVLAALARISLGNMTMYVFAFRQGQSAFQSILGGISSIYEHNLYMSNLFAYLDAELDELPLPATPTARLPAEGERGIRLVDVSFRYPGSEKWILRHVDLFVPAKQSIAIVGQNGAGKTTLIKLLTRLYRPTEGHIFLDGKDLADWDEAALRSRFGVVFQDFNEYQLTARENVGVGAVSRIEDGERIARSVDQGGARPVIDGLKEGIDTQLGRWFADGSDLSGGQWQKIALARGFMREDADILVLDEPTAALDAEAEHAVFERFQELTKDRTTIIISHRFPTVRMADRILVVEKGEIVEDGTHAELVRREGTYARLYGLQARGYV